MTKAQLIENVLAGQTLVLVEYRSTKTEVIPFRDKETGRTLQMRKIRHHVEAGPTAFAIEERVPENLDLAAYKSPFTKGQMVVWHLETMSKVKGVERNSGVLELFEASAANPAK